MLFFSARRETIHPFFASAQRQHQHCTFLFSSCSFFTLHPNHPNRTHSKKKSHIPNIQTSTQLKKINFLQTSPFKQTTPQCLKFSSLFTSLFASLILANHSDTNVTPTFKQIFHCTPSKSSFLNHSTSWVTLSSLLLFTQQMVHANLVVDTVNLLQPSTALVLSWSLGQSSSGKHSF